MVSEKSSLPLYPLCATRSRAFKRSPRSAAAKFSCFSLPDFIADLGDKISVDSDLEMVETVPKQIFEASSSSISVMKEPLFAIQSIVNKSSSIPSTDSSSVVSEVSSLFCLDLFHSPLNSFVFAAITFDSSISLLSSSSSLVKNYGTKQIDVPLIFDQLSGANCAI